MSVLGLKANPMVDWVFSNPLPQRRVGINGRGTRGGGGVAGLLRDLGEGNVIVASIALREQRSVTPVLRCLLICITHLRREIDSHVNCRDISDDGSVST